MTQLFMPHGQLEKNICFNEIMTQNEASIIRTGKSAIKIAEKNMPLNSALVTAAKTSNRTEMHGISFAENTSEERIESKILLFADKQKRKNMPLNSALVTDAKISNKTEMHENSFAGNTSGERIASKILLFADKQKRKNKNNTKLKHLLTNVMVAMLLFSIYLFTACGADSPPGDAGGLPFGIFPLNDVKWEHSCDTWFEWRKADSVYDAEGKLIKVINYGYGQDGRCRDYTTTYSVKQIEENRAELYCSEKQIWRVLISDKVNKTEYEIDTTLILTASPKLAGTITIEGKKVYYHYVKPAEMKILLYDFSLNVEDTFCISNENYNFVLVSIDSVLVGNEYRKRQNFQMEDEWYGFSEFSVIEGIGCNKYLLYTLNIILHDEDKFPVLRRVYYKEQLIWKR